ncbi:hypothetical protein DINM_001019 [Dirofilaria immitis]|nr:hypothetical protein [Dirofilaria immitis]
MPHTTRLKRSIFKPKNGGTMLIIIIALAIGVPILIIIISVIIITRTVEDELPKSLIENCRQAEPPLEEQGKYLPELFDASAFQFKGPLIIEYPKLHILEHDLTNIKPDGSNVNDHVQFDENLNVAYNIGDNVEIIVKNYGQGTKGGSAEMIKDGGEEDEETNVRKKFKPISDMTEKTQPSRYSESSTQTLIINGETSVGSPAKHNVENVLTSKRKSKSLRETASTILLGQIRQAPMKLRTIMSFNKQRDTPSTDTTNITPTMQTTKSQRWTTEDTNVSITGSTGSEAKAATRPKICDQSE